MIVKFELDTAADRPILKLDHIFKGCTALLDTGAVFPVWTKNKKLLEAIGGKSTGKQVTFGGFGGNANGEIYTINLSLDSVIYPNMHIIACENNDIPGFFLFSATMFAKMQYTVDNITKEFRLDTNDNQHCYNLKITDDKGIIHVLTEIYIDNQCDKSAFEMDDPKEKAERKAAFLQSAGKIHIDEKAVKDLRQE
ncbi:MAG: hypothetical protein K6E85_09025 [Lachnospiraceae bacterium]|nr:hypothetical protein [Lachnospiraceae bacterium]